MKNFTRRGFLGAAAVVPAIALLPYSGIASVAPDICHDFGCILDYEAQTITMTGGNTTLLELYQAMKLKWRHDDEAIRYHFPMMAITPELFEMQDGWKLYNILPHLHGGTLIDDGYGNRWQYHVHLGDFPS